MLQSAEWKPDDRLRLLAVAVAPVVVAGDHVLAHRYVAEEGYQ